MKPTPAQMAELQPKFTKHVKEFCISHGISTHRAIEACLLVASELIFTQSQPPISEIEAVEKMAFIAERQAEIARRFRKHTKNN